MIALLLVVLSAAPDGDYRVAEGDTCLGVARKMSIAVEQLHQLNPGLGRPPHRLVAGSVLKTVAAPAAADARLSFLRPDVERRPARKPQWSPATLNEPLFKLDEVATRRGAGAELTFADESRLQLKESALVVVMGSEQREVSHRKGGSLKLVEGELSIFLARFQQAPIEVQTPAGLVQASTPEAAVSVGADKMTRLSVFSGNASVSAQGATVKVKEGEGTRVAQGRPPEKPRKLPASPRLTEQTTRASFFAEGKKAQLSWTAVPGAQRYLVEVAREPKFVDLAANEGTEATGVALALPAGKYWVHVTAVDPLGLKSRPSAPEPLWVVALAAAEFEAGAEFQTTVRDGLTLSPARGWVPGPALVELREGERVLDQATVLIKTPTFKLVTALQGENTLLELHPTPPPGAQVELEIDGRRMPLPDSAPSQTLDKGARVLFAGQVVAALPPKEAARAPLPIPAPPAKPCARRLLPSTQSALSWPALEAAACPVGQSAGLLRASPRGVEGQLWLGASVPLGEGLSVGAGGQLNLGSASSSGQGGLSVDGAWAVSSLVTLGGSLGLDASSFGPFGGRGLVAVGLNPGPLVLRTAHGVAWRSDLQTGYVGEVDAVLLTQSVFSWVAQVQLAWHPTLLVVDAATGPAVRIGPVDLGLFATVQTRTALAPAWGGGLSVSVAALNAPMAPSPRSF